MAAYGSVGVFVLGSDQHMLWCHAHVCNLFAHVLAGSRGLRDLETAHIVWLRWPVGMLHLD